ncbi:MAG: 30S ribosome-binding factor RbfA [Oligoflexia bacterium]|nr:30S ribosome-binding factor RbfA [Oligoflexia bacterium]
MNEGRPSHRTARMADLVREEIARYFMDGLKDPRVGFVTVTEVRMTADLKIARVYYTVYGDQKSKTETEIAIKENAGRIRSHLAREMSVKFVPRLEFFVDEGLEKSYAIQSLLSKISHSEEPKS